MVAVHHVEAAGRLPYLVMQYIDGDSLQDLVVRDGPLDATTALRMTAQLASALSAAHDQGLVHRDVKPANILVGAAGQRVWITDFGLARAVDDASLTRTGFIAGTPHYMSPEQARGEAVRASSDLFGLGSVLYFVLTGRPPFRADRTLAILTRICNEPHRPVREVNPNVPPAVAELVDRLLSKSAADRFADAETVRTGCLHLLAASAAPDGDLCEIELAGNPVASASVRVEPNNRRGRFRYAFRALAILLLFGLSVVVGSYFMRVRQIATDRPQQVDDVAILDAEASEAIHANRSVALADPVAFAGDIEPSRTIGRERFMAIPATANTETNPQPDTISPMPVGQSPVAQCANELQQPTFDPYAESALFPADPSAPEPAQSKPPQSTVREGIVEGERSSVWAITLNELRASFELFETQIAQPPGDGLMDDDAISPPVSDSFGQELRRMENSLRMLESGPIRAIDHRPNLKNSRSQTQIKD